MLQSPSFSAQESDPPPAEGEDPPASLGLSLPAGGWQVFEDGMWNDVKWWMLNMEIPTIYIYFNKSWDSVEDVDVKWCEMMWNEVNYNVVVPPKSPIF